MHALVSDIPADGLRLQGKLPSAVTQRLAESLRVSASACSGAHNLLLTRIGERVQVSGAVQLQAELACSACLEPASVSLDVKLNVGAVPEDEEPPPLEGGELPAEAVELYTYANDTLNLTSLVHDEVVMELPQRVLCRADCQGLCPHCGVNLNDTEATCACSDQPLSGPFAALANFRPKTAKQKA